MGSGLQGILPTYKKGLAHGFGPLSKARGWPIIVKPRWLMLRWRGINVA